MLSDLTRRLALDEGLFYRRVMRIMRRIERVPHIEFGVRDTGLVVVRERGQQGAVKPHIRAGIRARLVREIQAKELRTEGETYSSGISVQHVPLITETEAAVADVESQINTERCAVIQTQGYRTRQSVNGRG